MKQINPFKLYFPIYLHQTSIHCKFPLFIKAILNILRSSILSCFVWDVLHFQSRCVAFRMNAIDSIGKCHSTCKFYLYRKRHTDMCFLWILREIQVQNSKRYSHSIIYSHISKYSRKISSLVHNNVKLFPNLSSTIMQTGPTCPLLTMHNSLVSKYVNLSYITTFILHQTRIISTIFVGKYISSFSTIRIHRWNFIHKACSCLLEY